MYELRPSGLVGNITEKKYIDQNRWISLSKGIVGIPIHRCTYVIYRTASL